MVDPFPDVIGTFMGRDALSLAVSALRLRADDAMLMPAYVCPEVLRPFLGKTSVRFYDIRPDLGADLDQVERATADGRVKMMMIINYFGFLQPDRAEIRRICDTKGIVLMEDCAHSLFTKGSGDTGDVAIYSFRKLLPVPDGGGLSTRLAERVTPRFYPKAYSNALSLLIAIKLKLRVRLDLFSRAGLTDRAKSFRRGSTTTAATTSGRTLPMSSFAWRGIRRVSFADIVERRRRDFEAWLDAARRTNLMTPVFDILPPGVCPLGFPVTVHDRPSLRARLERAGMPVKIHWHLPPAVGPEFSHSHQLSARILTLPLDVELIGRAREGIATLLA